MRPVFMVFLKCCFAHLRFFSAAALFFVYTYIQFLFHIVMAFDFESFYDDKAT